MVSFPASPKMSRGLWPMRYVLSGAYQARLSPPVCTHENPHNQNRFPLPKKLVRSWGTSTSQNREMRGRGHTARLGIAAHRLCPKTCTCPRYMPVHTAPPPADGRGWIPLGIYHRRTWDSCPSTAKLPLSATRPMYAKNARVPLLGIVARPLVFPLASWVPFYFPQNFKTRFAQPKPYPGRGISPHPALYPFHAPLGQAALSK